jgi:hypothetical protein
LIDAKISPICLWISFLFSRVVLQTILVCPVGSIVAPDAKEGTDPLAHATMANAERDINAQLGIFVAESDWQFDI